VGLLIKTVYQLAQMGAVTATEKFAFQQPPKHRQRMTSTGRPMMMPSSEDAYICEKAL